MLSVGVAGLGALALGSGGCAQILGLDSYKEGGGGSGTTTTSSSTTGSMTTTGTGSMTTTSTGTGMGGGGGAAPADCSTQGGFVDVMSGPGLSSRDIVMAFAPMPHVTFVATSYQSMMGGGVKVNIVRDNGQVDTPQSYDINNGGVQVVDISLSPGVVTVYARIGSQIGEVQFPVNGNGFTGAPATFTPYTDIPDVACQAQGYISDFRMQQPLATSHQRWVAVCRTQSAPLYEKVYVGDPTMSVQVSQEMQNEPADKIEAYFGLPGGQNVIFAGGDPMSGAWYRAGTTPAQLATKRQMFAENDPMRLNLAMAQVLTPGGDIQVFLATLANPSITPARLYVSSTPPANITDLSNMPPPGLKKIADITTLGQLGGFAPVSISQGRLSGAGSTVDKKNVLFTWMAADGTILARPLVRTADVGMSIEQAVSIPLNTPSYMVGWGEGNATTTTIRTQQVLCVGG